MSKPAAVGYPVPLHNRVSHCRQILRLATERAGGFIVDWLIANPDMLNVWRAAVLSAERQIAKHAAWELGK